MNPILVQMIELMLKLENNASQDIRDRSKKMLDSLMTIAENDLEKVKEHFSKFSIKN